jgi:hypothetical protein
LRYVEPKPITTSPREGVVIIMVIIVTAKQRMGPV